LRVDVEYQEGVLHRFEHGPAHIGLVLGFEGGGGEDGFDCQPLGELELVLVAAPHHPLAGVELTDELRAQHAELVVRDSSPNFELSSKPSFMGSRNVVYLSDFFSKRVALIEGAGYGWIPTHFIGEELDKGALVVLNTATNRWSYYPQLVVRAGQELGRAGRLFVETLAPPLGPLRKD
jgi:DNA-binding transcriptional LysR family regulator